MIPTWLHDLSIASLAVGGLCAAAILVDIVRRPQHMGIMNVVWPVTALFGTVLIVALYWRYGRLSSHAAMHAAMQRHETPPSKRDTPFWAMVAKGACHCGAGCTLGDICAEWLCFVVPAIAVGFGWGSVFGDKMIAVWIVDYLFALAIGIAFQYFAIKPMRDVSPGAALWQAAKADVLSLTAWQVGMYGFMALANFVLFQRVLGAGLTPDRAAFWFMMQIAMLCGFATAYPVNWWLIRSGVKEAM